MPTLELSQNEFKSLKKKNLIPIQGDSTEDPIYLEVSEDELEIIRNAKALYFEDEAPLMAAPLIPEPENTEEKIAITREEWRLYQRFKLTQQRDKRRKRKTEKEREDRKKSVGLVCDECGKVSDSKEAYKLHQNSHNEYIS